MIVSVCVCGSVFLCVHKRLAAVVKRSSSTVFHSIVFAGWFKHCWRFISMIIIISWARWNQRYTIRSQPSIAIYRKFVWFVKKREKKLVDFRWHHAIHVGVWCIFNLKMFYVYQISFSAVRDFYVNSCDHLQIIENLSSGLSSCCFFCLFLLLQLISSEWHIFEYSWMAFKPDREKRIWIVAVFCYRKYISRVWPVTKWSLVRKQ